MPTLDEYRALAAALPPSERLQGAEAADVLSAVVAVLTRGEDIFKAAQDGSTGVAAYLHQQAVDAAAESGADEPVKGAILSDPAPAVTPAAAQGIDYDKLAAAIVKAQSSPPAPAAATPEASAVPEVTPPPVAQTDNEGNS